MYQEISQKTKDMAVKMCTINQISPPHNLFYYYSILYSTEYSIKAFEKYANFMDEGNKDPLLLISLIQEAIGHATSLSYYFLNGGGQCH